jgi:hypothetical protein
VAVQRALWLACMRFENESSVNATGSRKQTFVLGVNDAWLVGSRADTVGVTLPTRYFTVLYEL